MLAIIELLDAVIRVQVTMPLHKRRRIKPVSASLPRLCFVHVWLTALLACTVLIGRSATVMAAPARTGNPNGPGVGQKHDGEYALFLPNLPSVSLRVGQPLILAPAMRVVPPPVPYHAKVYSAYTITQYDPLTFPTVYTGVDRRVGLSPYLPPSPPALLTSFLERGPALSPPAPTPTPTPTSLPRITRPVIDYSAPSPLPQYGLAMYYNAGVMQEVLANRLKMGHVIPCQECIGYVALLRAGDLNRKVWLQWHDGVVEGPFLVADAAAPHHIDNLLARNWVVDVDHRTATRRGIFGPTWVAVLAEPGQAAALTGKEPDPVAPTFTPTPTPAALLWSGSSNTLPDLVD